MPVPYRKTPRAAELGQAAYVDSAYLGAVRTLYGGLMVIDGKGQPLEFVHNTLVLPEDMLWPESRLLPMGSADLMRSLFDACWREPDLLVCRDTLGTPEFWRTEIAPVIPLAQVTAATPDLPAEWNWVNAPPSSGMRAAVLAHELARRGFITEPFERLWHGLRILYPQAPWLDCEDSIVRALR